MQKFIFPSNHPLSQISLRNETFKRADLCIVRKEMRARRKKKLKQQSDEEREREREKETTSSGRAMIDAGARASSFLRHDERKNFF